MSNIGAINAWSKKQAATGPNLGGGNKIGRECQAIISSRNRTRTYFPKPGPVRIE